MINPEEFREAVEAAKSQGLITMPPGPSGIAPIEVSAPTTVQDIQVTAENSDEMSQCQNALINWCLSKLEATRAEHADLQGAYEHAVNNKWRSDTLKRHAGFALRRVHFYENMLSALEHGYQIVPSFPVTVFAVRTDNNKPLKMLSTSPYSTHEQIAPGLPTGEGEFKNPFPVILQKTIQQATSTEPSKKEYWADAWKDLEFPLSMSKPRIMEATTRAIALKIFDDLGILPSAPKTDPVIVARIRVPTRMTYDKRWVSFIVAWHLDTATL